jgi:hypothetical protein
LVLAVAACGGSSPSGSPSKSPAPSATASATALTPDTPPDIDVALQEGDAPENPYVAFGSLWVVAHHAAAVVRLDLVTGRKLARIPTGWSQPGGIIASGDLLWVTHYNTDAGLVAIDPRTNKVVRRVKLPGESCCQPAVLGSTIWVSSYANDAPAILAVDARTGRIGRRVDGVDGPVVVGGKLWAMKEGVPMVVDPLTGSLASTPTTANIFLTPSPALDGLTWATLGGNAVGLGADGGTRRTVTGPGGARMMYLEGMAVTSADTVWVADGESVVWRIDPGATEAVRAVQVHRDTVSISGDGKGGVWVALFGVDRMQHFAAP